MVLAGGLRDGRDVVEREEPRQRHLRNRRIVCVGDLFEHVVVEDVRPRQWRAGDDVVVVFGGVLAQLRLLEIWVHLDLVGEERRVQNLAGLVQVTRLDIRDTDVSDRAGIVQFVETSSRGTSARAMPRPTASSLS